MSKMQKYTLMGLMLLILCLVTWALATGLGILQGNAAAAAAKEKLGLAPALYGVGSTGPIAAALERGSLAASAVWSDFAAGYLAVEGAVRTARGEDWQPQPLAFSILRGEDIYEPDNQKLLFPVAS